MTNYNTQRVATQDRGDKLEHPEGSDRIAVHIIVGWQAVTIQFRH